MVNVVTVKKILSDKETSAMEGKKLGTGYYKRVFREDVDVKDEDGNYILRFRKRTLPKKNINSAYNGMIEHARKMTSARGMAGGENGGKPKQPGTNVPIASNIIGYFDTLSLSQKAYFRDAGMSKQKPVCRQTAFTMNHPLKWKQIVPLLKDIDRQYKKLFPKQHARQLKEAKKTGFVIDNTAFSTITTNLNFQTACHFDKGDYRPGFGNLVVIERGKYDGGYTGFPQYGIAVDVREGDFLGMDVHRLHGNEPIVPRSKDAERLSLVSYLRENIPIKCAGHKVLPASFFEKVRAKAAANKSKNPDRIAKYKAQAAKEAEKRKKNRKTAKKAGKKRKQRGKGVRQATRKA
jgi:hypothetical protein